MAKREAREVIFDEKELLTAAGHYGEMLAQGKHTELINPTIEPKETPPLPPLPDETRKRRPKLSSDYETTFLNIRDEPIREKVVCITIAQRHHHNLSKIVGSMNKKIPLSSYLDNILTEHFELHKNEINEVYRNNVSTNFLIK